jgi:hypothetical protein
MLQTSAPASALFSPRNSQSSTRKLIKCLMRNLSGWNFPAELIQPIRSRKLFALSHTMLKLAPISIWDCCWTGTDNKHPQSRLKQLNFLKLGYLKTTVNLFEETTYRTGVNLIGLWRLQECAFQRFYSWFSNRAHTSYILPCRGDHTIECLYLRSALATKQ